MIIISSLEKLNLVIEHKDLRREKFLAFSDDKWIAIDNTTGDIWTEEFDTFISAVKWLTLKQDKINLAFRRELRLNI
ncbi:hypothetical protein [Mariniplasma anaerobium]|uniref:Uncharacterized protein n=1 Tax=Mariniplasma anaerobium TaxID=2735436 RepID=A0A7U9TIQ2_9MOLU|nr:hypothetical protein [Mariniplasma anaerobium]BCR35567.1 hypothetical protein MPAN_004600 [Mariniplasma anaerobium]